MLKILKPSKNKVTQGYSAKHKGYDHSGKGDLNYYSSIYGKVIESKNTETKNWLKKANEKLTTADYGNYTKIKGEIDGKVVYQLGAHFEAGSVVPTGTEVKAGQVVAKIDNTGNSTARHSHTEYRDEANKNFEVEFVDKIEEKPTMGTQTKEQIIIDAYKAITGEYPTDDEKKFRLQKNENTVELIEDLLKGDSRAKTRWIEIWNAKEPIDETATNYELTLGEIKDILRPVEIKPMDDTEKVKAKVSELVAYYTENKGKEKPQVIIELSGEDLHYIKLGSLVIGVLVQKGGESI